jgi:hypothetical protein
LGFADRATAGLCTITTSSSAISSFARRPAEGFGDFRTAVVTGALAANEGEGAGKVSLSVFASGASPAETFVSGTEAGFVNGTDVFATAVGIV